MTEKVGTAYDSNISAEIKDLKFDRTGCRIAVQTPTHLRFFDCELHESCRINLESFGGLKLMEFMERPRFVLLVADGSKPGFDERKTIVYDMEKDCIWGEVSCDREIISLRERADMFFMICLDRICVVTFPMMDYKLDIMTYNQNKYGLAEVASSVVTKNSFLVYPVSRGAVCKVDVKRCIDREKKEIGGETVQCHDGDLHCMSMSRNGQFLATASVSGTLIRVWSLGGPEMSVVCLLRRGMDQALIYHLAFDPTNKYLACCSSTLSLHIFKLNFERSAYRNPIGARSILGAHAGQGTRSTFKCSLDNYVKHVPKFSLADRCLYIFSEDDIYRKFEFNCAIESWEEVDKRSFLYGNMNREDFMSGKERQSVKELNHPAITS